MTKKTSNNYRKNYTYKICTATPDTTKRLIYMNQKQDFILNWTENNEPNELTKIDNNDYVTQRLRLEYRKNTHMKKG